MSSSERPGITIIVPVYNEETSVAATLRQIQDVMNASGDTYEIIAINDGSTDGTAEALSTVDGVRILTRQRNRGYGAALKHGVQAAAYETIAITDADSTYPNERIPDLLTLLNENVDMVVGQRSGPNVKIPLSRRPAKWMIQRFSETLAGYTIPDLNSGLRLFRRSTVLSNERILPDGFSFTTTITLLIASSGGTIVYEPIVYHQRAGSSKFHPIKDTWNMITLIVRSVLLFNPLRVFVPMALICFASAVGLLAACLLTTLPMMDGTISVLALSGVQLLFMGLIADLINRRAPGGFCVAQTSSAGPERAIHTQEHDAPTTH